jgi:hypothetical protein
MKLFACDACGQSLYFHNVQCTRCGRLLGFVPERMELEAFDPDGNGAWVSCAMGGQGGRYRQCRNYAEHGACNWMIAESNGHWLCRACRLNRTIPDLSLLGNPALWQRLQYEKDHLIYTLLRLGLPVVDKAEDPGRGLAFDVLAQENPQFREGPAVFIGHAEGVITLDVAEADDAVRERMRQQMAEPYRTLLGHFRHESGHYYWDRLIRDSAWLAAFRQCFGDERSDYASALGHHYGGGAPADWQARHVSAYASAHPWEDWAETWAHYLHLVDTLETAWHFGLCLAPQVPEPRPLSIRQPTDPYRAPDFADLVERWLALAAALNCLNQSMGQPDAYPFVLAPTVIDKLQFVHEVIQQEGH